MIGASAWISTLRDKIFAPQGGIGAVQLSSFWCESGLLQERRASERPVRRHPAVLVAGALDRGFAQTA